MHSRKHAAVVQIVVSRTDGGKGSSKRIVAPIVFVPVTILSMKLLVGPRIVYVKLKGVDPYDWTLMSV